MDEQDLDKLTERIIGCAYQVRNTLGIGFVERVYENAHAHEMRKSGLNVQQQYPIKVVYDGISVGDFFADILVENLILVELKAVSALNNDHIAQALNYLRASGLPVCLVINFGRSKFKFVDFTPLQIGKQHDLERFICFYLRSSPVNNA